MIAELRRWSVAGQRIWLDRPLIMGVLNVTPDSFSDGGRHLDPDLAVAAGLELRRRGADLVDVGGESTRPGADPVGAHVEIERVVPVIQRLVAEGVTVSIDTMKATVAEAAVDAGAAVINDVSGFEDPAMIDVAARSGAGVVVMHMQGEPRTMQVAPTYRDVVSEVAEYLERRAGELVDAGCLPASIVVDPGIGFGKTVEHNLALLDHLDRIASGSFPVMLGTSRKSFLGALTGRGVDERDRATAVTVATGVLRGAMLFRVHEPESAREAATIAWCIVRGRAPTNDTISS